MSSVPKSERSKTKLETLEKAYDLRKRITAELEISFAYSEKKLDKRVSSLLKPIKDPVERADKATLIREAEIDYTGWIIQKQREELLKPLKEVCRSLSCANKIWPTFWCEYEQRRLYLDIALANCQALQDELQYTAESLPADYNKYTGYALEAEILGKMIKAMRTSDNRFRKHLKSGCPLKNVQNSTNFCNVNDNGNANNWNASNVIDVRPDFTTGQYGTGSPSGNGKGESIPSIGGDR